MSSLQCAIKEIAGALVRPLDVILHEGLLQLRHLTCKHSQYPCTDKLPVLYNRQAAAPPASGMLPQCTNGCTRAVISLLWLSCWQLLPAPDVLVGVEQRSRPGTLWSLVELVARCINNDAPQAANRAQNSDKDA